MHVSTPLRTDKMATSDGLYRMTRLLEVLGDPGKDLRAIHIAGTNGKGSTAIMIASVLEKAGYSVGLYTSPHLEDICERIQIYDGDHRMISAEDFGRLEQTVMKAADSIADELHPETGEALGRLHYFEKLTAIAYLYFSELSPDYVVLECGLGGRLDSTNTLEKPLVSVITRIGLDHTDVLGKTIFKVAREKAGIIKPGVPVVSQTEELAVKQILEKVAKERGCEFTDSSQVRSKFKKYSLAMQGMHQVDNAATAVCAIRAAGIEVSDEAVKEGLESAVNPGRFEVLGEGPYWILDGAHNPNAVQTVLKTFNFFRRTNKIKKSLIIFGCMRDKNYSLMIQLLHENAGDCDFATVDFGDERTEDPVVLGERFANKGHNCICYDSVQEAYDEVLGQDYECVLIIGSIYLVGAVRELIIKGERDYVR